MAAPDIQQSVQRLFSDHLEQGGHRKTPERFAILKEIYALNGHFDIEKLYGRMKLAKYRVSRATLYNTIDLLMEARLVRKHQFGTQQAQYERAHSFRQHDHVICTECGKVMEFCDPRIQNVRNTVAEVMDFEVSHHTLHLYGRCPQCRVSKKSAKPTLDLVHNSSAPSPREREKG
ncbi:MAG: transcriptional repressor [Flavobacteriales bacterium]|nr:transcriptional repressor [Flavobacteriales bacterium]MBL0043425.1 transcriptional repressor [Flavobacteriales bacterium]